MKNAGLDTKVSFMNAMRERGLGPKKLDALSIEIDKSKALQGVRKIVVRI